MGLTVSCFGKLPFYREFLRIGLGSAAASWVVQWVERGHEAISKSPQVDAGPGPVLRFAAPQPGGRGVVAGVVRQSTDGPRKHPVALFIEDSESGLEMRWHLAPLALAGPWASLRDLLAREYPGLDAFTAALEEAPAEITVAAAEASWQAAAERPVDGGPWAALAGSTGDAARHLAANLLAVSRAQREARGVEEGVSFRAPLAAGGDSPEGLRAGLWLELFRAGVGTAPLPTIVLDDTSARLYAFYRPVVGTDLAAMLTSADVAPIDDLSEAWQTLPPKDASLAAAVDAIVAPAAAAMSDLTARFRAAGQQ